MNLKYPIRIATAVILVLVTLILLQGARDSARRRGIPGLSGTSSTGRWFDPYARYNNGTHDYYALTFVVSLDGFHPNLISSEATPFLHSLFSLQRGNTTVCPYMIPCFPSQTFPNHWSMVTGQEPGDHGIVSNFFYDSELAAEFSPGDKDPRIWAHSSTPVWADLQRAYESGSYRVAAHMWPGCEVIYDADHSREPAEATAFNGTETLREKAARLLGYLDTDKIEERPQLVLGYAPQVDAYGHGRTYPAPHTESFQTLLQQVDLFVEALFDGLEQRNLQNFTNVLVVSDHGMATVPAENVILWSELVTDRVNSLVDHVYLEGPALALYPKKGALEEVQSALHELLAAHPLGSRFALSGPYKADRQRIAPVWVMPEVHYAVAHNRTLIGTHGYNNTAAEMRGIFLASGPAFAKRYVAPLHNFELQQLLLQLGGVASGFTFSELGADFSDNFAVLRDSFGNGSTYNAVFNNETLPLDDVVQDPQKLGDHPAPPYDSVSGLLDNLLEELEQLAEWGSGPHGRDLAVI